MKTRITELLNIQYPVIQGGMMWVGRAELAAAVSNAGGLGILTALTQPTPEDLGEEIKRCRTMTDKPFGVNITILPAIDPPPYEEYVKVIIENGVTIVETAGRSPEPFMPAFKAAGIKIIHKCTSVRHAIKAEKVGCDAVSVDGFECAGHPGEDDVTNLVLLPAAFAKLSIPMVASGGIGNGRQMAAAMALGAEAINMGTRFVATKEAPVHHNVKQALVSHGERDTRLIMRTLRNTERVLHNPTVDKVLEIESRGNTRIEDIVPYVSGLVGKEMLDDGQMEKGVLSAGQSMGLVQDIPTCRELLDRIMEEAEKIVREKFSQVLN